MATSARTRQQREKRLKQLAWFPIFLALLGAAFYLYGVTP